ncbi:hypothetical protein V6N13_022749 [Hibiscus sabdariffa]
MREARSLPTHTTISPLTCPLRTSSSIHTHRSTTHTSERFDRGAEETMSEGTPQPLGTIKYSRSEQTCKFHIVKATVRGKGLPVLGVTLSRQVAQSQRDRASTRPKPRVVGQPGVTNTPTNWAWPGLGLAKRCISHSKGTLPDIGNLVVESLAAPLMLYLALRPTMPGGFDVRFPKPH